MRFILLLVLVTTLAGCGLLPAGQQSLLPSSVPTLPATPADTASPASTATVEPAATAAESPVPTSSPAPAATSPSSPSGAEAREATARELLAAPPARDDVRLAVEYRGADPAATPQPVEELAVGVTDTFFIGNVDDNTVSEIEAELLSIGDNAYFWFERDPDLEEPDPVLLEAVTDAFDDIYDEMFGYFGQSEPAGGRVHIVHAAPTTVCVSAEQCGLAGYFSGRDELPRSVNPWSNERAMFVMNANQFGGDIYLDVLTHELRHMLGAEYDAGDEDWFVEGAAMLAEDLMGFIAMSPARGSLFLRNPDQQLNSWTNENTIPYYGQGYLVNRFLYDRLGADVYREYTLSPAPGLAAVDAVAAARGLDVTGEGLWLDWLAAMALHDNPDTPEPYRWDGPELEAALTRPIKSLPATFDTTVSQFAADYYELPSSGAVTIDFAGAPTVSLLGAPAPSGEHFWYAQRANYSNPRLTRAVDLRGVDAATLSYQVYVDLEHGYDFAYVAASADGGATWQALDAPGMGSFDPANVALAERFYTGREGSWRAETIDLTPFAGQEILLRFETVTDPILTFGGFAIDDIAIPEIGFFDDAESLDAGWTAEGFTRATAELPQAWQLQLITFDGDGRPVVERLPVAADGTLQHTVQGLPGVRRPILIVSATAPETLQVAPYRLALH